MPELGGGWLDCLLATPHGLLDQLADDDRSEGGLALQHLHQECHHVPALPTLLIKEPVDRALQQQTGSNRAETLLVLIEHPECKPEDRVILGIEHHAPQEGHGREPAQVLQALVYFAVAVQGGTDAVQLLEAVSHQLPGQLIAQLEALEDDDLVGGAGLDEAEHPPAPQLLRAQPVHQQPQQHGSLSVLDRLEHADPGGHLLQLQGQQAAELALHQQEEHLVLELLQECLGQQGEEGDGLLRGQLGHLLHEEGSDLLLDDGGHVGRLHPQPAQTTEMSLDHAQHLLVAGPQLGKAHEAKVLLGQQRLDILGRQHRGAQDEQIQTDKVLLLELLERQPSHEPVLHHGQQDLDQLLSGGPHEGQPRLDPLADLLYIGWPRHRQQDVLEHEHHQPVDHFLGVQGEHG